MGASIVAGAPAAAQPGGGVVWRGYDPTAAAAEKRAAGYEWDPVQNKWIRSPTSAGQRANQYTQASMGGNLFGMSGLQQAISGGGGGMFGSGTGGTSVSPSFGGGGMSGGGLPQAASVPGIGPIDTSAANAAIFGRAKDVAGQTGRASLDSLRAALGETGQLGGGAEAQGVRDVVENAAGQVGDVNREMAIQDAARALRTAETNQTAGIAQRGQTMAQQTAYRGQDVQAQEAAARLAQQQANIMFQQQIQQSNQQLELLKMALGQSRAYSY